MILIRRSHFLLPAIFLILILGACEKAHHQPARRATKNPTENNDKDPSNKIPELSCEQQWQSFTTPQLKGRKTVHQILSTSKTSEHTTIIDRSILQKIISENNGETLSWNQEEKILDPGTGSIISQRTINKNNFIDLCTQGINLIHGDRPSRYSKKTEQTVKISFKDQELDVIYERYNLSPTESASQQETLELWLGHTAPYKGLVFKSKHTFFRTQPKLSENTIEKELIELIDPPQTPFSNDPIPAPNTQPIIEESLLLTEE